MIGISECIRKVIQNFISIKKSASHVLRTYKKRMKTQILSHLGLIVSRVAFYSDMNYEYG